MSARLRITLRSFLLFAGLLAGFQLRAQVSIRDSAVALNFVRICARPQLALSDLGKRYGLITILGAEGGRKFASNWYLHGGAGIIPAGDVREDSILRHITTPDGFLISDDGVLSGYRQSAQGFIIPLSVGKIIRQGANPNSGIYVEAGAQFLQHRIGFYPENGPITAIAGENRKGYDRLTNGLGLRQGIGYMVLSSSGYFNMSFGVECSQHFTQSRRSINTDTGLRESARRTDILAGAYVSWMWLIYPKAAGTYR